MTERFQLEPTKDRSESRIPAPYCASTPAFLSHPPDLILGRLAAGSEGDTDAAQMDAWRIEIEVLRAALSPLNGTLFLEFEVPRLGSRIDAVWVTGPAVFPVEFKCGEKRYLADHRNQAWDYALDLKNFHVGSRDCPILPILVATHAAWSDSDWPDPHADGVRPPIRCNARDLGRVLEQGLAQVSGEPLDPQAWGEAKYGPTPTIIEAARTLYARHSVEAITRNDAGARNLHVTSQGIAKVIEDAQKQGRKSIVFVTGVPGAGKTLVGLDLATRRRDHNDPAHAVYLSGNGPLVAVLREALTRDELARRRHSEPKARKGAVAQEVKPFIQNVHHFRDEGLRTPDAPPSERVVIFDEAQRAWNQRKTADFMLRRKKLPGFDQSEPEFLLSYMDRHRDWGVVVCLVGGGQEIHDGEAGIAAWLDAIRGGFRDWSVHISPELTDSEYAAGRALESLRERAHVIEDAGLHLAVSMRSFRTERLSSFVKTLLDRDIEGARNSFGELRGRYPIVATRNLDRAKDWIRDHARGSERYGILASSQAQRLKPHAIDVRVDVDPVQWFLSPVTDTRSSNYLEDAATEFQIQGLELDWTCVTWDADLRAVEDAWGHHSFRGDRWTRIRQLERQQYLLNAYRVLLTRARQGMVIFVPPGDNKDPTRPPEVYDATFDYFLQTGIAAL